MTREQKCMLATRLQEQFGIDFFDEEGYLAEQIFDEFLRVVEMFLPKKGLC